jgi:hypothetical protein
MLDLNALKWAGLAAAVEAAATGMIFIISPPVCSANIRPHVFRSRPGARAVGKYRPFWIGDSNLVHARAG